jgi:cytoskeletal protein CcmA (bactofilin family)
VEGNVTALGKLDLTSTAQVDGTVSSPEIAIAAGAQYGKIQSPRKTRIVRYKERRGLALQNNKTDSKT